ncbi:MAG: signal peptidase II [Sphingomonas sp.]
MWWLLRESRLGDVVSLGLVLGGAAGNILDRTRLGYVVDYADLHFGNLASLLVFNVADAGDYHRRGDPADPRALSLATNRKRRRMPWRRTSNA